MDNNIVLETKLVADIKGAFYVPSYQRGYRWGEDEVNRLLDDVFQNGQKNYCLQPVVVRKKDDAFELVDGQQRLTTIYLVYKYMSDINPFFDPPAFNLIYETREQSAEFLANMDLSKQEDNIDFWFIANAYKTIKSGLRSTNRTESSKSSTISKTMSKSFGMKSVQARMLFLCLLV